MMEKEDNSPRQPLNHSHDGEGLRRLNRDATKGRRTLSLSPRHQRRKSGSWSSSGWIEQPPAGKKTFHFRSNPDGLGDPRPPQHDTSSAEIEEIPKSGGLLRLSPGPKNKRNNRKSLQAAKKEESLYWMELDRKIDLLLLRSLPCNVHELARELPLLKLAQCDPLKESALICSGPTMNDELVEQSIADGCSVLVAARTVSTYPQGKSGRNGDPICDSYLTQVHKDGPVIVCVADGCGWGQRSREAAIKAKAAFADHASRNMPLLQNTHTVADCLVRGIANAHYRILEGKETLNDAGTTTLLGGIIYPLEKSEGLYAFVFVSVGDCKVFYRKRMGKIIDLTLGNRFNVSDPKDPGGRIGPYSKDGMPDFRNLRVCCCVLESEDMLILCSDGLSDNFDPELNGLKPMEIGLDAEDWTKVVEKDQALNSKSNWACKKMEKVIADNTHGDVRPPMVVKCLIDHSVRLTEPSREWMESANVGKLPEDYKRYPGKMDHTTCMVVQIMKPD